MPVSYQSNKLISWASIYDQGTILQAEKTARLPIVYDHVALMPDAHVGMGATVGSVIPTEGAIIPAAVGVDIGCFRGDTRIPLLNGRQKSLKDLALAGGFHWVYSLDADQNIVPGHARALKTRINAPLVRVTISGGEEITCTPDHLFMMNDGSYKQAQELHFNDSLMPLREHVSNHKVISIEVLDERADVYCLQVEKYNNFALAAGIFVHNCGMVASLTNLTAEDLPDDLSGLMSLVEQRIPAGVGQGHGDQGRTYRDAARDFDKLMKGKPDTQLTDKQLGTAVCQYGTLGSGNHFGEICLDSQQRVWTVLHSGSRGIGNQLAQSHIRLAKAQEQALEDKDLAYFLQGTSEFEAYIQDMLWAQDYALGNRRVMANALNESLFEAAGAAFTDGIRAPFKVVDFIDCHHNFSVQEEFDGKRLWITRKGAIKAYAGDRGVIPGSMGTASYIVSGRGVQSSWCSCSHGAGRTMSRSAAKRELTEESLTAMMEGKTWNGDAKALLDEHPSSYKDIDQVMADQEDLVQVEEVLTQVLNYKGTK
jgi:tRNA-splicing ligase RtcB